MAWMALIPIAIQVASSISQNNQANQQNEQQRLVNYVNSQQQYATQLKNIQASGMLSMYNARAAELAAESYALSLNKNIEYNVSVLETTAAYNDALFDAELEAAWEQEQFDLQMLRLQREKERGAIEASQAASGVVMGQDSAADVVVDQKLMEELDAFIISRNADKQVAALENARMRSQWESQMQIQKLLFEGSQELTATFSNARMQAAGIRAESAISTYAGLSSAQSQLVAGMFGANNQFSANQTQISNNFTAGIGSAVGQGISSYYKSKPISTDTNSTLLT